MNIFEAIKKRLGLRKKPNHTDPRYIRVLERMDEPSLENICSITTTRNSCCQVNTILINEHKNIICRVGYIFASRSPDQLIEWEKRTYDHHPIDIIEGNRNDIEIGDELLIIHTEKAIEYEFGNQEQLQYLKQELQKILHEIKK